MDYDDVVIGSGLAALGTVLGLSPTRRVLVLGGPADGPTSYYDARRSVPCAMLQTGGLGSHWHGVIPTALHSNFGDATADEFSALFRHFYPRAGIQERVGRPHLFVPWRPIRPARELQRLAEQRAGRLTLLHDSARSIHFDGQRPEVAAGEGRVRCQRLWVAAGALHTPGLMASLLGPQVLRRRVSDHVLCYVGQVRQPQPPQVIHTTDGMYFQAWYGASAQALYTLRPARFKFRELDFGIEQRAVFGLPTGSIVAKLVKRMSPGLLAEALYNRAGLFPRAEIYSVYAQVRVEDAYSVGEGSEPLQPAPEAIGAAGARAREGQPFSGLLPTRRTDIWIPGIHLHQSLDEQVLAAAQVGKPGSAIQLTCASTIGDIGPEHHSFKMMLRAARRARLACEAGT